MLRIFLLGHRVIKVRSRARAVKSTPMFNCCLLHFLMVHDDTGALVALYLISTSNQVIYIILACAMCCREENDGGHALNLEYT
jgi:hypothetical protein